MQPGLGNTALSLTQHYTTHSKSAGSAHSMKSRNVDRLGKELQVSRAAGLDGSNIRDIMKKNTSAKHLSPSPGPKRPWWPSPWRSCRHPPWVPGTPLSAPSQTRCRGPCGSWPHSGGPGSPGRAQARCCSRASCRGCPPAEVRSSRWCARGCRCLWRRLRGKNKWRNAIWRKKIINIIKKEER